MCKSEGRAPVMGPWAGKKGEQICKSESEFESLKNKPTNNQTHQLNQNKQTNKPTPSPPSLPQTNKETNKYSFHILLLPTNK
jgi:hypothetical protein